jgi:hypothetical protein
MKIKGYKQATNKMIASIEMTAFIANNLIKE